jgi:type VI secretion system protein ImpA
MLDLMEMALPLEGDDPAGVNLEYDSLYMAMDSLAQGTAGSQMGDSVIEGRDPDWRQLAKNCRELWGKTRDLRVASYLVVAETALDGLGELVTGLKLITFLVTDMWDSMYPRLDPDDDNDPTERLNILAMLSPDPAAMNDPVMFINRFRATRLLPSLSYTIRDMLIATKELASSDGAGIELALLKAEIKAAGAEAVRERLALAQEAESLIKSLCGAMNEKMSGGYMLDMDALRRETRRLAVFFAPLAEEGAADDEPSAEEGAEVSEGGAAKRGVVDIALYRPTSRADAVALLQKGADYFRSQEPNSPIPLLIDRAVRISEMSFIDLLQDIVPDALSRGKEILGIKEAANSSGW